MDFSLATLTAFLEERLKKPLPGATAHQLMGVSSKGNARPSFDHSLPPRPSSVLILFYEQDGQIFFPLIKRPEYVGTHSGQVSLPGGKTEPGENYMDTAIRETFEEIGVKDGIRIIGRLSDFHVAPSNFLIAPVIGVMDTTPLYVPDPFEVARVIVGSLTELLEEGAVHQTVITIANTYKLNAACFEIDGEIVWGATAMMLSELREILRQG